MSLQQNLVNREAVVTTQAGRLRSEGARNLRTLLLMFTVALWAHLQFSWMGFSPTDEGWILAYSRRILAGQVPHRDYMRVQVPGTEFFHSPEVLFGGEYTYWISRFVAWIQIAIIAWACPIILSKLSGRDLAWHRKFTLSLICFAFTACTFPVIVWPTYDGIFLISIGLLLVLHCGSGSKLLGYFLIGLAYVCKQNFIVVFPCFLLILGDWRKLRYWAAAILPGALYLGSEAILGAMRDLIIQVGSATTFKERAILPLFQVNVLLGVGLGCGLIVATRIIGRKNGNSLPAHMLVCAAVAACGVAMDRDLYLYSSGPCWMFFGFSVGIAIAQSYFGQETGVLKFGFLAIVLAWSSAISNGFNFPTLGCGVLAVFLLQSIPPAGQFDTAKYAWNASIVATATVLVGFYVARHHHIYRDVASDQLTERLDGVLPGGRLLRTNRNTYEFLHDLNDAIRKTQGERFAIIPGFPAYWVKGNELDPIPLDWPYIEVLSNPKMTDRLVKSLADQKGHIVLIVEKVEPTDLRLGFKPLDEPIYPAALLSEARTRFEKVGETRYFELRK